MKTGLSPVGECLRLKIEEGQVTKRDHLTTRDMRFGEMFDRRADVSKTALTTTARLQEALPVLHHRRYA
jgi:hypothetical protein